MTSTMRCAVPKAFRIDTCLVPRPTTTRLGTVWLAITLTFDVAGAGRPAGQTDTKLVAVGCVTVTFSATAVAPAGTPPAPATVRLRISPGPSTAPPRPPRVSTSRMGTSPSKPSENHPITSTMTWAVPKALRIDTWREPSPTMTRLATV